MNKKKEMEMKHKMKGCDGMMKKEHHKKAMPKKAAAKKHAKKMKHKE